jgi:cyclopropane-fatty-acyl-phospholipid synthase
MSDKSKAAVKKLLAAADIKINGNKPCDIKVLDERFYDKVLSYRELGIGEAYMDGWWNSNKLDETVSRLLSINIREKLPITPVIVKSALIGTVANRQKLSLAHKNASSHYNIGNDLYEKMLGKRMLYTCAYWEKAKNLDDAQTAKLERVCKKLYLKPGMKVIDLGCGWGGFAEYAAREYGVSVTGVNVSSEQVKLARERTKGLSVKILQKDYREVTGKYDRVVSIGIMEHIGPKNYQTFLNRCRELLNDDGLMFHHTIGNIRSTRFVDPWTDRYIFPGGVIPSLAQISKAAEKILLIEDVENFGPDYDKTLMAWHKNFVKIYPQLKDKYDERFYRMWEYYLLSCAGAFRARKLQLYQIVMRKSGASEAYRAYR